MNHFANTVLWVYIIFLVVGGLIGFFKGKSQASLITSVIFAGLLVLTAVHGIFAPRFAMQLSNIIMVLLLVVFAIRLAKTKKFMPAGMLLVLTLAALVCRNLIAE